MLGLDSLGEQADAPLPGLTHRYPDKALFLVIDTCPVYCRFCTRSYAVGVDTDGVEKVNLKANKRRWAQVFEYVASRPELEDIVISGDSYNLRPDWIQEIGKSLLSIPHLRRIRFASKGLAVMPQKALTDDAWFSAVAEISDLGRSLYKEVAFHTHFNHGNEITELSARALQRFFDAGVKVRNQTVLLRGVNDTTQSMGTLVSDWDTSMSNRITCMYMTSFRAGKTCEPPFKPPLISKSTFEEAPQASTRLPSWLTLPVVVASAESTVTKPMTGRPASRSTPPPR